MISIIGAGKVGSSAAFNILRSGISDVVLIDIVKNLARGREEKVRLALFVLTTIVFFFLRNTIGCFFASAILNSRSL